MDYPVLRCTNVYGMRQDSACKAGVVAILIVKMLTNQPSTINGSGEQERDFVYVGDCARANLLALEKGSGIYNIGVGVATNIKTIFTELKRITEYPGEALYGSAKLGETFRIYLDNRRSREGLGWEPTVSLSDGLAKTVAYFRVREILA